jgi:transcriptional regulator with XRE-family HTH domain
MELDLFKLHSKKEDNTPFKWILASGTELSTKIDSILGTLYLKFKKKDLDSLLAHKLKVSKVTIQRLRRNGRKWYPIIFLQTLMKLCKSLNISDEELKNELAKKIELIKCNNAFAKPVKAVKKLTINFCKIAGAHAADGTLFGSLIRITDEDKQAVEAFKGWIENLFEVKLPQVVPVKNKREWSLTFHSKIIARYLKIFFKFPSGTKTYFVDEPKIIKNSNLDFRKAFALGVLTFEAGIGIKPKIEFCVSSKRLRDSICKILELTGLEIRKSKSGKYWRFWSKVLTPNDASKWLEMFEQKTEKWFKIYEIANGFQGKVSSVTDVFEIFDEVYPSKSGSKVSLNDIFRIILEQREVYRYQLVELIKRKNNLKSFGGKWAHGVVHYLNILKRANIITTEKRSFGKKKRGGEIIREIYKLNSDITSWKVPFRPWLKINYVR